MIVAADTFYSQHVHASLTNLLCTCLVGCTDAYAMVYDRTDLCDDDS